jgi:hypothetical protein
VFFKEMPAEDPPNNDMEQVIKLELAKGPMVVCSYQYEHFNKSNIERPMEENLKVDHKS